MDRVLKTAEDAKRILERKMIVKGILKIKRVKEAIVRQTKIVIRKETRRMIGHLRKEDVCLNLAIIK